MIQGVIFDMDGLMFDTERIWATLWAPALERLGQPAPTEAFVAGARGLAGENMLHYLAENYPACDPQQLLDAVNELGRTALANGAPAKPGLFELLDWLEQAGIPRVVASSSTTATCALRTLSGTLPRGSAGRMWRSPSRTLRFFWKPPAAWACRPNTAWCWRTALSACGPATPPAP